MIELEGQTRPLGVLIVSTTMDEGGAQRVTSTLLRHFDRSKILPSLCLLRKAIAFLVPEDVSVFDLEYRGLRSFLGASRRLRDLLLRHRPHIILSNANATNLLTGWALRDSKLTVPWIARIGNSPALHDRGLRRWTAQRVYGRASAVVTNSHGLASEVARSYPILEGRIDVIGNPTDFKTIDRLAEESCPIEPPSGPVMIAVGRLFRQKRYDVMLDAFSRIDRERGTELWVCGDGPEAAKLKRLAARLGIEDRVRWLGFVSNPYPYIRTADLFLMTSDHEGLPNALIEAQGLGLPAVSTRCPHGPDEVIEDGITGVLCPVGDADGIGRAVVDLLTDDERCRGMGAAARERAHWSFDHSRLVETWENLIISVLQKDSA